MFNFNPSEFTESFQDYDSAYIYLKTGGIPVDKLIQCPDQKELIKPNLIDLARLFKICRAIKPNRILEYGCGIAPITYSLKNYSIKNDLRFNIADIRQINSHYAKWRLPKDVNFIEIKPYKNPFDNLKEKFDVVFLVTVMEHLPDPLEVVKNIHRSIKKGGYLLFDYILSDGHA